MNPMGSLRDEIAVLVSIAGRAAIAEASEGAVAREAAAFSAALCAGAAGAAPEWAVETGASAATFAAEAARGEPWKRSPTPILRELIANRSSVAPEYALQLAVVASAACSLGEPSMSTIDAATFAASAQRNAAGLERATSVSVGEPVVAGEEPTAAAQPEQGPPVPDLATLLAQLDGLVGLTAVKSEIHRQTELLRVTKLRHDKGLKSPRISRHMVFVGNPGTGKTTVARLVAGIYHAIGVLPKGQLVECDRSELVAGYVGQTAIKTAEVVTSAIGGVLFIDEAYALASDDFGKEAVDTLVKEMEDHREELVVIVAGYPEPMRSFVSMNPGLESRFGLTITFADYSDDELLAIFDRITSESDFTPAPETRERLRELLRAEPRGEGFGNARFVRNLFEHAIGRHAWRLRDITDPTVEELRTLVAHDLDTDPEPGAGVSQ